MKNALDTLQSNFSTAANNIGNALVALGVSVPSGTSLATMASLIRSNLKKPAKTASGSFSCRTVGTSTTTQLVTFGKTFNAPPNMSASGTETSWRFTFTNVTTTSALCKCIA